MSSSTPRVFITGASSGLGRAMAKEFARRGYDLALAARRTELLQSLVYEIQEQTDVKVFDYVLDVTDSIQVSDVITQTAADLDGLDIVIANAGVGEGYLVGEGPIEAIQRMVSTNITGLMSTLECATRLFKEQGSGQLVGISSVAGARGLPRSAVYCATKAAVTSYMDALRVELLNSPIIVTTIAPGFIDTPINEDMPNRPFLIDAENGARQMVDVIEAKRPFAYVPAWPWAFIARLLRCLPDSWLYKLIRG